MAINEIAVSSPNTSVERNETFAPRSIGEAFKFAEMLLQSGMLPKSYKDANPATIVVVLQHGLEIGFQPLQALQCIANINGMPSVWGDGALALVKSKGLLEYIKEDDFETIKKNMKATCVVKRRGEPNEKTITFGYDDAKSAGIFGNAVWKSYPYRMCMLRARAFALRDVFPDVLKGLSIAEEVNDYVQLESDPQPAKTPTPTSAEQVQRDTMEEPLGKQWGTSFYRVYSASGYLKEEADAARAEFGCGPEKYKFTYDIPKRFQEDLDRWAATPKPRPEPTPPADGKYDFDIEGQDEPGSNG